MIRRATVLLMLTVLALAGALGADEAQGQVVINEVFYGAATAAGDWIEFKNVGGAAVDISTYWVCSRFIYARISTLTLMDGGSLTLQPGDIITVGAHTNLDGTSADLGLYTNAQFANPASIVDFLQWGGGGIGRENVADAANLWVVGDFVPTTAAGHSLQWGGANSGGAGETLSGDCFNNLPTKGVENTAVPVDEQTWGRIKAMYSID